MKLYSVSDEYIEYLRKTFPRVYSNKVENRIHTWKYLGVVFKIDNYNYYVPLSSPKNHDYIEINGQKKIRKDSIIVIRMIVKGILKGTLQIGTMIPVPDKALISYDLQNEEDILYYKELVQDEIIFIRKNSDKIIKTAKLLYSKKVRGTTDNPVIDKILDFKSLEKCCDNWK